MTVDWPDSLVAWVRAVKRFLGFFSDHTLAGIPLDLIVRFFFLGALQCLLRRRLSFRRSAAFCLGLLLVMESLELVAVRNPLHPRMPDLGDLMDLGCGAAGVLAGELLWRRWRRPERPSP